MDIVTLTRYRILVPAVTLIIGLYTYGCSLYYAKPVQAVQATQIAHLAPIPTLTLKPRQKVATLDLTDYRTYPMPEAQTGYKAYQKLFQQVSYATGVEVKLLAYFAAMESSFRSHVKASTSTARGLFQFTDDTWEFAVKRYGAQYGITQATPRTDVRAATIIAALTILDNERLLKGHVQNRDITATDLYLVHFLGRTGAIRFIKAHPAKVAAKYMPAQAKANKAIFYDGKKARTYKEIRVAIRTRVQEVASDFGIV